MSKSTSHARRVLRPAFCLAGLVLLIRVLTAGRYGYFRDELYFLDCGEHLAWGYVDHAPMIALVARLTRTLFGDSLFSIRLLPALASAAKMVLIGALVRELGGGGKAAALACVGWLAAPAFLGSDTRLSMNSFEPLFWMGCVYVLLLVTNRQNPKLLMWFGVLAGLGMENKHSTLFFLLAVAIGLLLTAERRLFLTKWAWVAAAIAFLLLLPNLVWQVQHHWPTLEHLREIQRSQKNVEMSPWPFVVQQVRMLNVWNVLVWVPGLWFLLANPAARRWRALGWTYVVFLAVMMSLKARDYYLTPIYPMLFAAGGVSWERLTDRRFRWLPWAGTVVALAFGCLIAPFDLPILSPGVLLKYQAALHARPGRTEAGQSGSLPQHFGDEFGWPEMVATVAQIYNALPPEQRLKTAIFAGNYGEAGAVDFFGPRYGLPAAISAHETYYYWGPRQYTGESMIVLQWDRARAERYFTDVQAVATLDPPYAMDEERYTIYLCRGIKRPLATLWPELRH